MTAGGVELGEVNLSSMESRLVSGLYFAGELLKMVRPICGFSLVRKKDILESLPKHNFPEEIEKHIVFH